MFARHISLVLCAIAFASPAAYAAAPQQQFASLGDLQLENKAIINDCAIGYRTIGTLNADKSNAILFTTWHTGTSRDAAGMLQSGALFDPAPWYVIVVDALGNGVSCSPSNSKSQPGPAFPQFSVRDMVDSQHKLLTEKLGIKHVRAVMGYSMGGMQTFQWAASYPSFMDVAIPIAGTPRLTSSDMLFLRIVEKSMLDDPAYAGGRYAKNPALPMYNLLFAMNFDSPAHRSARTAPKDFEKFFRESQASDPDGTDANNSLWQIRAVLGHDIAQGGKLEDAAANIKAHIYPINAAQDHLVNPAPPIAFAKLRKEDATILDTDCGHAALRCAMPAMKAVVEKALR
ncbi:alpha/beta fold hydrolase [Pseudoduganella violaceinigra]|uniref:alpha/beta fold hydrolase n=1 Tax=Pseudoduganella violaceinigra TaxID=246602 RepID=UPI0004283C5C|nr:alpha/beta fold hydrolase [Pseudoduganella violaceinigra]